MLEHKSRQYAKNIEVLERERDDSKQLKEQIVKLTTEAEAANQLRELVCSEPVQEVLQLKKRLNPHENPHSAEMSCFEAEKVQPRNPVIHLAGTHRITHYPLPM